MAESSNYSRSVLGGSDEDYSRSVLGGSDKDYSRSVLGGSDEDYSRSLLDGSDKDYNRSVLGGSDKDDSRSVLDGSDEDYSRSVLGGSDEDYSRSVLGGSDMDYSRTIVNGSDEVKVTANLVSTIDTSISADNGLPIINDLTVVQTHYCVVTDWWYKTSVKVVDTRTSVVTSKIRLSDAYSVHSLTSVNDDQVAVAVDIKGVNKIMWFSVSASGIIRDTHKSIFVTYAYNGIIYSNDRFYAAFASQIDVISMQGQIITTFTNKSFSDLRGIAISHDHSTLYVCSFVNDTVFRLDLNGNVTASYKDNDLKRPQGITVDSDGYVYVCSVDTKCVHQLTADLNKVQLIIKDVAVLRCAFKKNDNSLIVGFNIIKIYNLTYH